MSERRFVVPEGMLKAVMADILVVAVCAGKGMCLTEPSAKEILLRALRWLSENPIVPTPEETDRLLRGTQFGAGRELDPHLVENLLLAWQCRMFLAPEPEQEFSEAFNTLTTVGRVKDALMGCTLTAGDAVELIDAVRMCVAPEPEVDGVSFYTRTAAGDYVPLDLSEDQVRALSSSLPHLSVGPTKVKMEPQVPDFDEMISAVLESTPITVTGNTINARDVLIAIASEAYRRGQKSKETL